MSDDQIDSRPHIFDVSRLAKLGITSNDIAKYVGISHEQLIETYGTVLVKAMIDQNAMVAAQVFDMALEGNLTACQFWLKNLGRWEDYGKSVQEVKPKTIFKNINVKIGKTKEDFDV